MKHLEVSSSSLNVIGIVGFGIGHFDFSQPDWSEFYDVLKGNGPCNVERMADRNKAWEDGQWVRDGMLAHARKKQARKTAAE